MSDNENDVIVVYGERIIPCGLYTIEETKSPTGLALLEKTYHGKVYQVTNGGAAAVYTENSSKRRKIEEVLERMMADDAVRIQPHDFGLPQEDFFDIGRSFDDDTSETEQICDLVAEFAASRAAANFYELTQEKDPDI